MEKKQRERKKERNEGKERRNEGKEDTCKQNERNITKKKG